MELTFLVAISIATLIGVLVGIYLGYRLFVSCQVYLQSFFATPDAVVLLSGKKKSGKTTIIELLNRGAFVPSYEATQQAFIKKAAKCKTQSGRKYVFWDTSGLYHSKDAQNLHEALQEFRTKNNKDIISVYVFNVTEYEQVRHEIESHVKQCQERGYIALALGTRGDKMNATEKRNLNQTMSKFFGIPIKTFDLTQAPIEEIVGFVEYKTQKTLRTSYQDMLAPTMKR